MVAAYITNFLWSNLIDITDVILHHNNVKISEFTIHRFYNRVTTQITDLH